MSNSRLSPADLVKRSDALHERVQAFASECTRDDAQFDALALEIARFQADAIPGYGRLVGASGRGLERCCDIPAVPVEAFRLTRVAAHASQLDCVTFLTSGTTSGARGGHHLRRTDTYRKVALLWGRRALAPSGLPRPKVLCLAPKPSAPQESSLGFMMQAFVEDFDCPEAAASPSTWLLADESVNVDGLKRGIAEARAASRPLLLLATSFALVHLLDATVGQSLHQDPRTIVMQTGGFKGKSRQVEASWLRTAVAGAFGIAEDRVVSEYGMTELCSQLYDGTLLAGGQKDESEWLHPPPWLRVEAVDPAALSPVAHGIEGLACFTDLANIDSAVRILTMDRIVCGDQGIKLLGRQQGAPPRGCSLAIEELLERRRL